MRPADATPVSQRTSLVRRQESLCLQSQVAFTASAGSEGFFFGGGQGRKSPRISSKMPAEAWRF